MNEIRVTCATDSV